jgi:hypothetical protein
MVAEITFNPYGAHNSLSLTTVQTLTVPSGATQMIVQALSNNVRITVSADGTAPTASSGFQIKAGDPPSIVPLGSRSIVKVVSESGTANFEYQYGGF